MDNKHAQQPMSKRQALRAERARQARNQRIIVIGFIAIIVIVIAAIMIVPPLFSNANLTQITPGNYQKADGVKLGDPNAKVTIEVFEDFKCSACQSYSQNVEPQVIKELVDTGKAYYIFHNFPFLDDSYPDTMKESDLAANASMCAAEQNRFWDFKTMLFANLNFISGEFTESLMKAIAKDLGLDSGKFSTCLKNNAYQSDINASIQKGTDLEITGTPSIFVNSTQIAPGYVPSLDQIKQAVDAALAQ